jgi:hypothetical protein
MAHLDLALQKDTETYVNEALLPLIGRLFEKDGRITPVAHLFVTRNKNGFSFKNGQIGLLILGPEVMRDPREKNAFAEAIAQAVVAFRAIAVTLVMESWWVESKDPEEGRRMYERGLSIADHPDRLECVMVMLEHLRFQAIWRAPITRDAEGKGTLGPFSRFPDTYEMKGRFTDLLHKERFS